MHTGLLEHLTSPFNTESIALGRKGAKKIMKNVNTTPIPKDTKRDMAAVRGGAKNRHGQQSMVAIVDHSTMCPISVNDHKHELQ